MTDKHESTPSVHQSITNSLNYLSVMINNSKPSLLHDPQRALKHKVWADDKITVLYCKPLRDQQTLINSK